MVSKNFVRIMCVMFLVVTISGCSFIDSILKGNNGDGSNSSDGISQKLLGYSQLIQKDVLDFCEILPTITAVVGFVGIIVPPVEAAVPASAAAQTICNAYRQAGSPKPENGLASFTANGKPMEAYTF